MGVLLFPVCSGILRGHILLLYALGQSKVELAILIDGVHK